MFSLLVSCITFIVLSLYAYFEHGYYDLYIANKVIAGVAFVLLGKVLILGPLSRLYDFFDKWLMYRKQLGFAVFFYALLHSVISLFMLPDYFPPSRFLSFPITFIGGLSSMILLTILFLISFNVISAKMEKHIWWKLQYWGVRLAGLLLFLHILPMKYEGWKDWYILGKGLPPQGMLIFSFGVVVLLTRLSEFFSKEAAHVAVILSVMLYAVFLGLTIGLAF